MHQPLGCMKACKTLETPLQLHGHLVMRVVTPWTNHSFVLPLKSVYKIRNTSAVVWSCGYCVTAIQVAHQFDFGQFSRRERCGAIMV